jgi:hypothetical protein
VRCVPRGDLQATFLFKVGVHGAGRTRLVGLSQRRLVAESSAAGPPPLQHT